MSAAKYNLIQIHAQEPYIDDESVGEFKRELRGAVKCLSRERYIRIESEDGDLMDWIGDLFGFQSDNVQNQREHVVLLLANRILQQGAAYETYAGGEVREEVVGESVKFLYEKLLQNYKGWCAFVRRPEKLVAEETMMMVAYMCLYLLVWGESSNLRFMPECLCYIFHHLLDDFNSKLAPILIIDDPDSSPLLKRIRCPSSQPYPFLHVVVSPIYDAVRSEASASHRSSTPHSSWRNYDDMNEFFWSPECFSDLGWPPPQKRTPPEPACDYTHLGSTPPETACVYLSNVPVRLEPLDKSKQTATEAIGIVVEPGGDGASTSSASAVDHHVGHGRDGSGKGFIRGLTRRIRQSGRSRTEHVRERVPEKLKIRQEKKMKFSREKQMGFKVGFVEQRSFWNIFHSFPRLWIAQLLVLHLLIILAFMTVDGTEASAIPALLAESDNQFRLLYVLITWSALLVVQAFLSIILQFSLVSSRRKLLALRMGLKLAAAVGWTAAFSLLLSSVAEQRGREVGGAAWSDEANRRLRRVLVTAAVFLVPEGVGLILFFAPWAANGIERSHARLIRLLSWWFSARTYVGRGLRQDLLSTLKYAGFWAALFALKIIFSYNFQIRPLVAATRGLLSLKNVEYQWYTFFGTAHRFEVLLLWVPVLLIYLMDVQIWYSIFSSVCGVAVGLFSHIGDIRNMQQLRHRFPDFAFATVSALLDHRPRTTTKFDCHRWLHSISELWNRVIRHLRDRPRTTTKLDYDRCLPNFSKLWNPVIRHLRAEDLLNDHEEKLLLIPCPLDPPTSLVPRWPALFLVNEVAKAVHIAQDWNGSSDSDLWDKIARKEYRKLAVTETLHSVKDIVLRLAAIIEEPHRGRMRRIVKYIENCMESGTFLINFQKDELKTVSSLVAELLRCLLRHRSRFANVAPMTAPAPDGVQIAFFDLLDALELDFCCGRHLPPSEDTATGAVTEPSQDWKQIRRTYNMINEQEDAANVPRNLEARRRLAFFSNSVFMQMPRPAEIWKMLAFSVLIPHYDEDVMYHANQLESENEDGITIMYYLKKIFPDEWDNFEERMSRSKTADAADNNTSAHWATLRGQTLYRTVRGMMYYNDALKLLDGLDRGTTHDQHSFSAARLKFTLVVASQQYGKLKKKNDIKARDIGELLKMYPEALRVAYVDAVEEPGKQAYDAVLVKYDRNRKEEVEVYRIRLPGEFLLGEGKPENQNQAIIFTRGEALQTIDMNQENYFEEALKMGNLLREFEFGGGGGRAREKRRRRKRRILGIREHVFTGSVSSLAFFMSAQESSFVTLGQRVLAEPLKVRMHYGHPDVFDRLWFLTRGGISKASKTINISEDIYAGFNCTLRGGVVSHHEYIQVGKGRDVGLNQIATFEAKIAGGNGEQTLSRDVHRLGHSLDFARMISFYYTTIGFYADNLLIVLAAYAYIWSRVYMGLSGVESAAASHAASDAAAAAFTVALNQQFLVQLGLFTSLPLLLESWLELGFTDAVWRFLLMQLQLCSVFYTFSLGTKAHFYGRTLLHGGARYKGTGRGFVVRRVSFAQNYRLHSRSHFVKGVELIILLLIYAKYGEIGRRTAAYAITMLAFWFLALSWILAPFLFNPSGFDWLQMVYDYDDFMTWLWQGKGESRKPEESWEAWWNEQQAHLDSTGPWGKVAEVVISFRFFLIQYGMVYRLKIAAHNKSLLVYILSWTYVVVAVVVYMVVARAADKYAADRHIYYRSMQMFVLIFVVMVITLLALLTDFQFEDLFVSMLAFLPTGWGILCMAAVLKPFLDGHDAWLVVVRVARLYDLAIAHIVMGPVAVLSWLPSFQSMQTRILFNPGFSRGLQVSKLFSGKKANVRRSSSY